MERRSLAEEEDIGLQGREAALRGFRSQGHHIVEILQHRAAHGLGIGLHHAVGAAVRPVELEPVAHGAAEKIVDRHAQRLCLEVEQGVLDRGDGLLVEAAMGLARHRIELLADALMAARVVAGDGLDQRLDDRGQPLGAIAFVVFGDACDALVGLQFQEREVAPSGIAVQGFAPGNFHFTPSRLHAA